MGAIRRLNTRQYVLEKCKQGEEICLRRETLKRCVEASMISFHINVETLHLSNTFPYLGQMITYNNSNWAAVYLNMRKARRRWGMVARVLEKDGSNGVFPGRYVQGSGAVGAIIWQSKLGGDWGYSQGPDGVPP